MSMRILGPMDTGGPSLSPRERTILTALIVRRDAVVSPAELAEACWGEAPPATWAQQIRNAVAKIRSRLGAEAVRTVGVDYRLGIEPDAIDAVKFEQAVAQARRQALQGAHDRAAAGFRKALALWRGAPLPDAADWPPAVIEAARLVEIRRSVEEELLDARLSAGERGSVIADAERLVREEPLREHRWAILALANYRADRQAEAIAVIRGARERLAGDLGIDPSRSLVDLETAMLRQDRNLEAPEIVPGEREVAASCPYRGLVAYGDDDRALFFGRDADIEEVLARCGRQSVVSVVGPSGSGKSSLVRAGVVPRLRDQGRKVVIVTPGSAGAEQLRASFGDGAAVVCIDQAEELRTLPDDELREVGVRSAEWVERGGCLVLALRSDFIDWATGIPSLGTLIGRGLYALPPLGEDGLREAITRPAESAGLELEPGLVELILRDAGGRPGILPPLSHALVATWTRREGATLTVDGYETSGGIAGAIALSAEQVFRGLSPTRQEVCRSFMMRLVERTPEGVTVRRRVPLATLNSSPERRAVVEALVQARLVTIDGDAAIIAHEAVGTTWPRLDGWLTEDAANARILRRIEAAAAAWDAAGRPPDDLLRGARLHGATEWRDGVAPDLTAVETAYLDASLELHRSEIRELEARSALDRRRNSWLRGALVGAALLLVAAVVSGGIAVVRGNEASAAAEDATIEALAATSLGIRDSDRAVAALLAVELQRRWPDDSRARSALFGALTGADGLVARLSLGESRVNGALVPGTRTAFIVEDRLIDDESPGATAEPRSVRVIDLDDGRTIREYDVDLAPVDSRFERDVFVSEDGSTAFIQSGAQRDPARDSCCRNYFDAVDLTTGEQPFPTVDFDDRTGQVPVVVADGSRAYFNHAVTGDPGWVDLATGAVVLSVEHDPLEFEGVPLYTNGLALIDERLYVGGEEGIVVYDASSLERLGRLGDLPGDLVNQLLLPDGDGGLIVSGNEGGVARLDLASGEVLWQRAPDEMRCGEAIIVPPDRFVCTDGIGQIRQFELATGRATGASLDTLSDRSRGLGLLPETEEVVTFTTRSPASLLRWRVDGMPAITRPIAEGQVAVDGFGADDTLLITADAPAAHGASPGAVRLWNVEDDTRASDDAFEQVWVGRDTIAVNQTGLGDQVLRSVDSDATIEIDMPDDARDGWFVPQGSTGSYGFVVMHEGLLAFDPGSGEPVTLIETAVDPVMFGSGHSQVGEGRVSFTWWDADLGRTVTSVHDIASGEEVARGLEDDETVVGLPGGDVVSASAARLNRSTGELEPVHSLPKSGVTPAYMNVSDDGSTLLLSGHDQRIAIYDVIDVRRLGDEISTPQSPSQWWPAGFLSSDGRLMATNTLDGVLLWDLDPGAMRDAACRMVGRDLTELEWATYFGDEAYHAACADSIGSGVTAG
ncbi:nSTAND1 domain-containing NTPase [Agromyces sp. SYSU T00266]|uniref:nSTAND1 domain-containing NTPase n=1 Tax=Agromyces zhanjiangensis TaxID=3158562 RepID=UPI0033961864